ncbi:hypothetical protein BJX61DRAFT_495156 [Aspergillus egyptiacus]|nr:hypothetical protein BJX61DRAFT_495156 [Aspergillus egyptiacus]
MSEASTLGWSLRKNGSCLEDLEVDCGETVEPYRVCCPQGSFCPHAYNVACCPSSANCTDALQAKPACANSTWDLYYNGGYFCCEQGKAGYATDVDSNGCGTPGESDTPLEIISSGTVPTSTPTSSPTTSSTTSVNPTTTQAEPQSSSGTDTGAIVGGVVGGVCGAAIIAILLWLLFRKRQQNRPAEGPVPIVEGYHYRDEPVKQSAPAEMDGAQRAELAGDHRVVAELPGHYGR